MSETRQIPVGKWRLGQSGSQTESEVASDSIATEIPVAISYNRVSHVVMMATPKDLEEFAVGFSITEGLVGSVDDITGIHIIPRQGGIELALTINADWFDRLSTQRRNLVGRTGCGICGAENIEQALRDPKPVSPGLSVTNNALQHAVTDLENHQPLQGETGATHGAAWCLEDGTIACLYEDVGRHNALDKLIGSLYRAGFDPASGFVLVSSRASYEMVYKTAAAGIGILMAVSAPTTLAVDFAHLSGLTLVGFARPGRHNVYTFPDRITQ